MKENRSTIWTALGAVVAGILASSCCIGPVALAALGAGSVGFATALAPYRPYFLGLTFLLLAVAFYATYRKPAEEACCAQAPACVMKSARRKKIVLWVVTGFVLAAGAFPQMQSLRSRTAPANNGGTFGAATVSASRLTFKVDGMTCGACAIHVQKELAKVPGVTKAAVSFESKQAVVEWSDHRPSEGALAKATEKAGYKARVPLRAARINE